jgi:signal transduction histidine kinase
MTSLRRALLAIGGAGFAAGLVALAFVLSSEHARDDRTVNLLLGPLVGWAFIGAGLVAWWRRPENNFGSLMTLVGFAWFAGALTVADAPGIFIAGVLLSPLPFAVLIHLLLGFPTGRVEGRTARALVALAYIDVLIVLPIGVLFVQTADNADIGCEDCPSNPLVVSDNAAIGDVLRGVYGVIALIGLFGVATVLVRRWRAASPAQRRTLGPLYLTGGTTLVLTGIVFAADFASHAVAVIVNAVAIVVLASVPFAFLASLLRNRLARAGAVSEIVATSGGDDLREVLAGALGDPSLELAYWLPDREQYVDREGRPAELPEGARGRSVTRVYHDGRCVAAIVHDSALDEERELVQAAGDAAALALENERLDAELAARIEELQDSRARIVEVGLAERRRLERDLHDGAQQRLVALRLHLRMARDRAAKDPDGAREMLDAAMAELDEALAELRELARGIHPAVLADRGLEPALNALASRAPLPVEVTEAPHERLPATVEAAAYFVVAEALTNVARYAEASHATVAVERRNGHALVEVRDDGVGGADVSRGTGLTGLADRLAALDGRLEVVSPSGGGTVVRADIPCG